MDIECFGCINWVKASEILFEGLIVGLTVVVAYLLGRKQADRDWQREINQREKEQKEAEENEINLRLIDAISKLVDSLNMYIPKYRRFAREFEPESSNGWIHFGNFREESASLIWELEKMILLFTPEIDQETNSRLIEFRNRINNLLSECIHALQEKRSMEFDLEEFSNFLDDLFLYTKGKIQELVNEFG